MLIRQLGYPTKNALKGWCREYEQHLELPSRCAAKTPKYSEAQKLAAVEHYRTHDHCIAATMRALGYTFSLGSDEPGDFEIDLYEDITMRELAEQFVDEGLYGISAAVFQFAPPALSIGLANAK